MKKRLARIIALVMGAALFFQGCGSAGGSTAASSAAEEAVSASQAEAVPAEDGQESAASASGSNAAAENGDLPEYLEYVPEEAPEFNGLTYEGTLKTGYAEMFTNYYYSDGFRLLHIENSGDYLMIPEGAEAPEGLPEACTPLYLPLDQVYLAATASMSLIAALDSLDMVTMTGTDVSGWNIEAPKKALEDGSMVFAGRYSEPDYELLVANDCDLALESTMIRHTPEVQEMLEDIGIPVMIEMSSYETTGLGRSEWIKFFGTLTGKEEAAEEAFEQQVEAVSGLQEFESTGKTVAYFSINSNGAVVIRHPKDYIITMLEDAGGVYAFADIDVSGISSSTLTISMEEFYSKAVDCDFLVYNSVITGEISGSEELTNKDQLFADFKAVREGNIWQVDRAMYQSTDKTAMLARDFHIMLTGGDPSDAIFLKKLG